MTLKLKPLARFAGPGLPSKPTVSSWVSDSRRTTSVRSRAQSTTARPAPGVEAQSATSSWRHQGALPNTSPQSYY